MRYTSEMDLKSVIGLVALAVMLLAAGGVWLWTRKRDAKIVAAYPTSWVSTGVPPPAGLAVALEIIRSRLTAAYWPRWGGTIIWTDGYFPVGYISKAAGVMQDPDEPRIKLTCITNIWETALAHEIYHVEWVRNPANKTDGEGEPRFYTWINDTNDAIKARLRPVG